MASEEIDSIVAELTQEFSTRIVAKRFQLASYYAFRIEPINPFGASVDLILEDTAIRVVGSGGLDREFDGSDGKVQEARAEALSLIRAIGMFGMLSTRGRFHILPRRDIVPRDLAEAQKLASTPWLRNSRRWCPW